MTENICGWIAQAGTSPVRAALKGAHRADWLVIGGGFTGLAAAHTLAELHPGSHIVVVDRQRAAQGASARNSGFVVAYERPEPEELVDRTLNEQYHRATAIGKAASDEVSRRIATLGIACDLSSDGYFFAVHDPGKLEQAEAQMETLQDAGANAKLLEGEALARRLGSSFYKAAIWCGGGNGLLQPAKYAKGLLDTLPENVSLYENTEIVGLERRSGGSIRARSHDGNIDAARVIICVGAFLHRVGVTDRAVFPLELSASLSRPLNEEEQARLGNAAAWGVLSTRVAGATVRLTPDRRLMIRNTVEYRHRDLAGRSLAARRARHLQGLQRRFPWIASEHLEYTWTGHLSATRSGEPRFAQLEQGVYVAAGCNGSGVARGTLWGKLLAEMASGGQSSLLTSVLENARPGWLPPRPFFDIGAAIRMQYESRRAKTES
ncbi:NAD(P)/FAD-dependent oxidoreductase [Burkholderia lata]|uniref:Oxidoreductase n=1 Tax=Burkholderia lata (strain ATCC 17760 / DSM 23089 / LMG 22485 / NCIMB 9086 / R18194 / 383) TaxID=482957 RepID=A0A6P2ZLM3_BURL3|nr:FAD-dependent oxidoreductase [Burkholderia lata]VWD31499.1 oxidoreductase [Burkholderia lata]